MTNFLQRVFPSRGRWLRTSYASAIAALLFTSCAKPEAEPTRTPDGTTGSSTAIAGGLVTDGVYTLTSKLVPSNGGASQRLDVASGVDQNGQQVGVWNQNNQAPQNWYFEHVGNNVYAITTQVGAKNKQLDADNTGGIKQGSKVQIYGSGQRWLLEDAGSGYYYLTPEAVMNQSPKLRLDVAGGRTTLGTYTNVQIWPNNDHDAQKWKLEAVAGGGGTTPGTGTPLRNQVYKHDARNIDLNPLKGLVPNTELRSNDMPYSMERFYLGLSDVMTGDNTFNWTALDDKLNDIASRGNQGIFRVYIDYPGRAYSSTIPSEQLKLPAYLLSGSGAVALRDYSGNASIGSSVRGKAPDWNNARLVTALTQFIRALAQRYDGDPRIAYFTVGIYGFWGEWNTYPYNGHAKDGNGNTYPDWQMNSANRYALLKAYADNFTRTHVCLRYPQTDTENLRSLKTKFGYHDDSFAYETLSSPYTFWELIKGAALTDIWRTKPVGGEVRPEVQGYNIGTGSTGYIWDNYPNTNSPAGQNYDLCVGTTHATWMWCASTFDRSLTATQRANALKGHRRLGYEFFVSSVDMPGSISASDLLNIRLRINNGGVAPFPYNWRVDVVAVRASDNSYVRTLANPDWQLPSIQPNSDANAEHAERTALNLPHGLAAGDYKILLRFANPRDWTLPNGTKAPFKPVRFANEKQDADLAGWLTLGNLTVR